MSDPDREGPDFLTPKQIAEKTGLDKATIYRVIANGHLPSARVAGVRARLVRIEDYEEWVSPAEPKPPAPAKEPTGTLARVMEMRRELGTDPESPGRSSRPTEGGYGPE